MPTKCEHFAKSLQTHEECALMEKIQNTKYTEHREEDGGVKRSLILLKNSRHCKMVKLKVIFTTYSLACFILQASAFSSRFIHQKIHNVAASPKTTTRRRTVSLKMSAEAESNTDYNSFMKEKNNSPASFGSELHPFVKTLNQSSIHFIKTAVFDTMFVVSKNSENSIKLERQYARFYALETIARMPYFAYLSVLHLYETLGWFRKANYLKLHFCESWNEMHHLLIMESLGGDKFFKDRFLAQHIAFFYYWFIVFTYIFNPILAYNLNQSVEEHAASTYQEFIDENKEVLQNTPAPQIAKDYYLGISDSAINDDSQKIDPQSHNDNAYMFHQMRPQAFGASVACSADTKTYEIIEYYDMPVRDDIKCETLLDVFTNIRDDELDHVTTMKYLQKLDSDIDFNPENTAEGEPCDVPDDDSLELCTAT